MVRTRNSSSPPHPLPFAHAPCTHPACAARVATEDALQLELRELAQSEAFAASTLVFPKPLPFGRPGAAGTPRSSLVSAPGADGGSPRPPPSAHNNLLLCGLAGGCSPCGGGSGLEGGISPSSLGHKLRERL
jgi:hypothetical protein